MYDTMPAAGEHPRLFFCAPDLPALREKLAHPDCRRAWSNLLAACERMLERAPEPFYPRYVRAPHLAFAYLITGREEFAAKAIGMTLELCDQDRWFSGETATGAWRAGLDTGASLRKAALVYDWLHDVLSGDQRSRIRAAILEKGLAICVEDLRSGLRGNEWYTCNGMNVLNGPAVMAALLLEDEADTADALALCSRQIRRAIASHCPDGGYPEGPLYWNYGIRYMLMAVEPLRRLKGIDLYQEPFLRNTGDYVLHTILPWLTQCANTADSFSGTRLWPAIAALAAIHRRPDWQWLARRLLLHEWPDGDGEAREYSLFYLLYYDPGLPASPPSDEQRTCLFSGLQQLSLRSAWDEDAIHALWLNGPSNCHHNHLHLNSFTISAFRERLLVELGKFDYSDYGDERRHTGGHNSLLVDGEGQIITTDESIWCRRIRAGQWGTVFGEFRCLREEAGATIATGSVVNAYHKRLRTFDRTLAFVEHRFFFVHDHVELDKQPPVRLDWYFHSGGDMELRGQDVLFRAGDARMLCLLLCADPVARRVTTAPPELDRPDKPVKRLVLGAVCEREAFDLFMLLVPARAGEEVAAALDFSEWGTVFRVGQKTWQYDPVRQSLGVAEGGVCE